MNPGAYSGNAAWSGMGFSRLIGSFMAREVIYVHARAAFAELYPPRHTTHGCKCEEDMRQNVHTTSEQEDFASVGLGPLEELGDAPAQGTFF